VTGTLRPGKLDFLMPIQPSPAGLTYTVGLRYRHGQRSRVTVLDPPLARHPGASAVDLAPWQAQLFAVRWHDRPQWTDRDPVQRPGPDAASDHPPRRNR
jgi:hypothetical protein